MTEAYVEVTACRACRGPHLQTILDLGTPVLSDFPLPEEPDPPRVPLDLVLCDSCRLVQLRHTTDPYRLYVKSYWYRSGVNDTMREELADVVRKAAMMVGGVGRSHTVVDVGANDGTLLACYESNGQTPVRVAYEPALSLNEALRPHADLLFPELFTAVERGRQRSAAIITSIAVFNHVDDPRAFVQGIDYLLADDGVWVVQMQDLAQQTQRTAYDNVCHEHVTYYTLETFEALLAGFDLVVAAVEQRAINGGSLRFYVRRRAAVNPSLWAETVLLARQNERWCDLEALARFAARVERHKYQLVGTLDFSRRCGVETDMYGASTKSSTLLQHCGIDATRIRCAVERTPDKWGRVTSGTRIPIISEEEWRLNPAPQALAVIWQFRDALLRREAAYLSAGGTFLFPLPHTEAVNYGQKKQRAEAV